ncbi:Hypothetical_protein [Hexamita inflata]|uniref:Hypothetical_protein n=1 Tax=Hexamita inflata TaxID=28002 RepID=A0AA86RIC8_9EUKA|nr:Hypothetical protein HINF_LOCUS62968 [Hexamita inflata]
MQPLIIAKLKSLFQKLNLKMTEDAFNLLVEFVSFHFTAFASIQNRFEGQNEEFEIQVSRFLRAFSVDLTKLQQMPQEYNLDVDDIIEEVKIPDVKAEEFDDTFLKTNGNEE